MGLLLCASNVFASEVTLAWDRSRSPEVTGYKLYYGTSSRVYSTVVDVKDRTGYTVTELAEGVPYFFTVTAYDGSGHESGYSNEVSQIVYENAEDLSTGGWDFCPQDPGGAEIRNVYDEELQRQVIELSGSGFENCYLLRCNDFSNWDNSNQLVIAWDQKSSAVFRMSVVVSSTGGHQELRYSVIDDPFRIGDSFIRFGLGNELKDGQWHHVVRDLQADLDYAFPGERILLIKNVKLRGNGRVTDIKLMSTPP